LSWVIVGGVFVSILGSDGIVNRFISYLGFEKIMFLMDKRVFRSVLVVTSGWKDFGWGSIVYLAAITSIDQEMYEAAIVDGANRFQRMIYVTLPGIMSTIILMLILRIGNILEAGFSQIFVLYSSVVYEVADIIGTYVYRIGISRLDFSFGTAVGLFDSVVSIILVMTANFFARKWSGKSIW
ncbi:MAG TPA: sugar ABC transporter permease, partial [Clostridiaceae bacterium]|nr:sugar ABC transporter permease [Clostridiaceae bacterium]